MRAVVERHGGAGPVGAGSGDLPPVTVVFAEGDEDVAIKISDRGGGISSPVSVRALRSALGTNAATVNVRTQEAIEVFLTRIWHYVSDSDMALSRSALGANAPSIGGASPTKTSKPPCRFSGGAGLLPSPAAPPQRHRQPRRCPGRHPPPRPHDASSRPAPTALRRLDDALQQHRGLGVFFSEFEVQHCDIQRCDSSGS